MRPKLRIEGLYATLLPNLGNLEDNLVLMQAKRTILRAF